MKIARTTDCLNPNCGARVEIDTIDNLENINPNEYTILVSCKPCNECEFTTVLEYVCDFNYSLRASEQASNEWLEEDRWMAQSFRQTEVFDWTLCGDCGGEARHRSPSCAKGGCRERGV